METRDISFRSPAKPGEGTRSREIRVGADTGPGPAVGWWMAAAACVVDLAYAAISAYWGLGGRWLLSTVSASLARTPHTVIVVFAVWVAVVLKAAAAVIPLLACHTDRRSEWHRGLRMAAWAEGVGVTLYGFVLTFVGLLVQAGLVHPGKTADRRALAWHAYLWDPWFLVWGLLVVVALYLTRVRQCPAPQVSGVAAATPTSDEPSPQTSIGEGAVKVPRRVRPVAKGFVRGSSTAT